ncbi:RlpA-like double-psi beta-barrel-protein domain-containing protein-containing protein [Cytidiella melzeri]|nr:RlpA-like double-psi beta-barrel-protein domain-containing protein-containing protein [Cytidiella melzeri]
MFAFFHARATLLFVAVLLICTLSSHAAIIPAHGLSLSNRHITTSGTSLAKRDTVSSSKWTYYEAGKGACGGTNNDNDWIVAVDAKRFDSGGWCGKTIQLSYNGKSAKAQVVDRCEGCTDGGLDLTPGLFSYFASEDEGVIYGSWST